MNCSIWYFTGDISILMRMSAEQSVPDLCSVVLPVQDFILRYAWFRVFIEIK